MVNSINEAWNERASSSDDSQLDLIKWTDSWLMTQGPSTLLAEFDSQTKKLSIRQGFGNKYASEVYREQRVDVLVYKTTDPPKKLVLENVKVAASEVTDDIVS